MEKEKETEVVSQEEISNVARNWSTKCYSKLKETSSPVYVQTNQLLLSLVDIFLTFLMIVALNYFVAICLSLRYLCNFPW